MCLTRTQRRNVRSAEDNDLATARVVLMRGRKGTVGLGK